MKKIIFVGRSECGKTTLIQALNGEELRYEKTQFVNNCEVTIDTPGEYIQTRSLGSALAMFTFEADVVGLILSATEEYSIYSPCITPLANRDVIGIVTKMDAPNADGERAKAWLQLAGCEKIFCVSAYTKKGIGCILEYLKEDNLF